METQNTWRDTEKEEHTQAYLNDLSYLVIGAAIEVHRCLGPGLLESVYQSCLIEELRDRHLDVSSQVRIEVQYKGKNLGNYLVIDVLVEGCIVLELKAVEEVTSLHEAQLLSYLKLTDMPKGLLINFNCVNISKEIRSFVTEKFKGLPSK
jgi:GxxExxY protein